MTKHLPLLAIIVPCFNEAEVLPETARRLEHLLERLVCNGKVAPSSYALFIDDGSTDRTWVIIRDLQAGTGPFGGIRLSRNFGHQAALMAGLLAARGDAVVSVDADLQDDLEAIHAMLQAREAGADIVCGARNARKSDTPAKRISARLYYRLLGLLKIEIVFDHADFRLLTRRAIEALREYGEVNLFLRALIPRLGFRTEIVTYERAERFAGVSKYPLGKMLALAFEGITSFSIRPLRVITVLGCIMSVLAFGLTAWAMLAWLAFAATVPGWASTVIPIYLVCSVQLLSLGVIGEYVGKIYMETKRRPRFHVSETLLPIEQDGYLPLWAIATSRTLPFQSSKDS